MKLLFDARFWRKSTGGIGRYTRELLHELLKLGTDDTFHVLLTPADEAEFDVRDKRVTGHIVPIAHYSLAEQRKLPGLIRTIAPDLTHYLNFNQPLWGGGKRVTTIHDLTIRYFPTGAQQRSLIRRLGFRLAMQRAASSDAVVAISRATKIDVIKELKPDPAKVHIIYEGADDRFTPRPKLELDAFRKRVGRAKPYILFVNQWRPHKGLPELVAAFDLLKTKYQLPHELVIAGKPNPDFPDIPAAIEASAHRSEIVLPGFIPDDDLPLYYAAAETLAFPSYYEGFGLGLLEAMSAGLPVVCTDTSSLPEVAGRAGHYVKAGDVTDLARGLNEVLTDPELAARLSKESLEQAKRFSWAKMAKETYAVYQSVLGQKK